MSNGRILIADDEATFLSSTAELLRKEGYEVVTVENASGVMDAIGDEPFDLLITDLEMPGNTDLHLVEAVTRVRGGLPIIVITGFPSVRTAVACVELPVAAYLVKPVHFPNLLARVKSAVVRFRSYQTMRSAEQRLAEYRSGLEALPVDVSSEQSKNWWHRDRHVPCAHSPERDGFTERSGTARARSGGRQHCFASMPAHKLSTRSAAEGCDSGDD